VCFRYKPGLLPGKDSDERKRAAVQMNIFTKRVLAEMSPELDRLYAERGRLSIPPESLLRALLLQVF